MIVPAKRKGKVRTNELPRLLQQHLRWALVLAKMMELDRDSRPLSAGEKKSEKKISRVAEIGSLIEVIMGRSVLTTKQFTIQHWNAWFAAQKESPVSSIYECRAFYGLDSPNNVVQRFERALQDVDGEERRGGRPGGSYELAMNEWGDYAMALVRHNGGHRHFFDIKALEDVIDIEPALESGAHEWKVAGHAGEEKSFIRHILNLQNDRYIQILLPPVGVLWPLWFLKIQGTMEALLATADERLLGPKLSKEAIPDIDLVTTIGQCAGLPYPFGAADRALQEHARENGTTVDMHAPWSTEAMTVVAEAFSRERWSPPVLLAGRGDQWSVHEQPGRTNRIVPIAIVSEASSIFGGLYANTTTRKKQEWESFRVAYETKTWGEKFVQRLKLQKAKSLSHSEFTDIRSHIRDFDLILSYFPVDLLLDIPGVLERITPSELAKTASVPPEELEYILPSTVLAAGSLLGDQPKMRTLVLNLVRVLHRAVEMVHHLRPRGDVLAAHFRRLRSAKSDRKAVAEMVEQLCQAAASRGFLTGTGIHPNVIPDWMRRIGTEMVDVLISQRSPRSDAIQIMNEWGWAQLLEYVLTTSIYVSVELF